MKKVIIIAIICIVANTINAQTKYGYAYAVSTTQKRLYISHPVNLANYSNCKDKYGYNTTISTNVCLQDAFLRAVKIEAGSFYSSYSTKAVTSKNNRNTYNDDDSYKSESDVISDIKDMIAEYREKDYTVIRIEP